MRELHQLSEHVRLEPRDPHRGVALPRPRPAPAAALQLTAENILWNRKNILSLLGSREPRPDARWPRLF